MHQHVCNSKLLYFIIKLRKMVKCLKKHNLLIFLRGERIVAKQILIKYKRWNLGCYNNVVNYSSHQEATIHRCSNHTWSSIRWKFIPLSLSESVEQWYTDIVKSVNGDWGKLRDNFCNSFSLVESMVQ
jgi:hypothetical protein